MRPKSVVVLAVVLCVIVVSSAVLLGYVLSRENAASGSVEKVLNIGFLHDVDSLNPLLGTTDSSRLFYGLVYDSMFSVGADLEPVGNLVSDWRIVPTTDPELVDSGEPYGSVWEYDLTTNAAWHDGEPFTSEDLAWSMNFYAVYHESLWAYQPYAYFVHHVDVVDADTVRIHFYDRGTGEPMPASYGDSIYMPVLPRHMLSTYTPAEMAFSWTGVFEDHTPPLVGTGPFMASPEIGEEFLQGDRITLIRNPNHHWADDMGEEIQFDKLVMYFHDDQTAMRLALSRGYLDVAQFPADGYRWIEQSIEDGETRDVATFDGLRCTQSLTSVAFNMYDTGSNLARKDVAVRQALAMATDRRSVVESCYLDLAEVGSTIISPINEAWHYEPSADEAFTYDLDAASQMLEDAGYVYTEGSPGVRVASEDSYAVREDLVEPGTPLEFDMVVRAEFPEEVEIAAFLKWEWAKVGVRLDYRILAQNVWPIYLYQYDYDLAITSWSSDPDPNRMLFCQSTYAWNGWSDNRYCNATYDDHYNASVMAIDDETRKVHVEECQRVHHDDVGHIVLAYPYQTYAWRVDTVRGWGDWAEQPGRSLDAYWGVNPLLFDLEVVTDSECDGCVSTPTTLIPYIVIAAVAIAVVALVTVFLVKRGKSPGT